MFTAQQRAMRALQKRYPKPKAFDANVIVIGAGSAGLVSALIATTVGAHAILIERHKMGGDCLNTGCVPSKALLRSAKMRHYFSHASDYGLEAPESIKTNFPAVMQRVQRAIAEIEPKDSVERYSALGVQCEQGEARLLSPWEVELREEDGSVRTFSAPRIIVAAGARPFVPPIEGLVESDPLTSDTLWAQETLPTRLTVLGAGPIGCEMAQAFARLGSHVTLVDMADRVLPREDEDASALLTESLRADGIELRLCAKAERVHSSEGCKTLFINGGEAIESDQLLVAVGRKANSENLGLEALGIELNRNGTIAHNAYLQTNVPTVYVCGDIAGPYQFTHTASHQAWFAAVNALFGEFKRFKADYSVIPWATFTDPQVARVGLNELEAKEQGVKYDVTHYGTEELDRAIADGEAHGFIKILTKPGKDQILGVTIVGYHAGELIAEYVLAMKHKLGLGAIISTIHIYPTMMEANKFAAGEWRKARKPEKVIAWLAKYHAWRRR